MIEVVYKKEGEVHGGGYLAAFDFEYYPSAAGFWFQLNKQWHGPFPTEEAAALAIGKLVG